MKLFAFIICLSTFIYAQEVGEMVKGYETILLEDSSDAKYYKAFIETHKYNEYTIILKWVYNEHNFTTPLTDPPGCPHYNALLLRTVYKENEKRNIEYCELSPIYQTFTFHKCYEDEPNYIILKTIDEAIKQFQIK